MFPCPQALQCLVVAVAGWINQQQRDVIDYLQEENRVLREQFTPRRLRFTDVQRRRLAAKAQAVGRRTLCDLGTLVTPDTLLRWHRQLIARKYDGSHRRGSGHPPLMQEIRRLIVRMAIENRAWGYTRIRGALDNLGHHVARGTIANVLKEHGLEPAPERTKRRTWREFLGAHWDALAAADFFTVEVWTPRGLTRFTVLVLIKLATRRVHIAGLTAEPEGPWVTQLMRNATDAEDGFLRGTRMLIHDRDPLVSHDVRDTLVAGGVTPVRLPARSPNLNAFAERFVRTIKESCLERLILIGEGSLRRAVREFVEHYHHERNHMLRHTASALILAFGLAPAAAAQDLQDQRLPSQDGPPAPIAPATVTRDDEGRATIRAVRLTQPLRFDGRLDEEIYTTVPAIDGFIQQLPIEAAPATELTDLWVFFDDDNLYISARCHDSQPERVVGNELRRDNGNVWQANDNFSVTLDTFLDRRNGFFFQTNPIGVIRDQAITAGRNNVNWNTVWDVRSVRSDIGYTIEMRIPFKSLRYRAAGAQVWGMNVRRIVKWKNEISNLTLVPASYNTGGVSQMAVAATLVGLETPAQALNLEVKPYAVTSLTTDRAADVPFSNDLNPNAGIDVKYGLTRGLTADVTVNTDFAQIEEDQQQINLTRFSLFFPEKRDFFLEGQGVFDFGGQTGQRASGVLPILFFSRRIGLSNGQSVPVIAGGRVTGKAGRFDVGALALTTDDKPSAGAVSTTFSALRVRRNILRRSSIGMMATGRWPAIAGHGENATAGVDADLRFFENVEANLYWARTSSPGRNGADASYRGRFNYGGDRYGLELDRVVVESNFNPEVGFVRRTDFALSKVAARFSPRLRQGRLVRRLNWNGELEYIYDADGQTLEDRTFSGRFQIEFNSSDRVDFTASSRYERLPLDFAISSGVIVPAGEHSYETLSASYTAAQQRKFSGTLSASHGSLYGGTRTEVSYRGRLGFSPHVGVEPNVALNWVSLPFGDFTARLFGLRVALTPTARLGFSTLTQFNPSAQSLTSSARMRWEYTPGSELFVVYSDGRDTAAGGYPELQNRSVAIKATRLFRF